MENFSEPVTNNAYLSPLSKASKSEVASSYGRYED